MHFQDGWSAIQRRVASTRVFCQLMPRIRKAQYDIDSGLA
jgi:hypothetical protein